MAQCRCESMLCDHDDRCDRPVALRFVMDYVTHTCTQCASNMCATGGADHIHLSELNEYDLGLALGDVSDLEAITGRPLSQVELCKKMMDVGYLEGHVDQVWRAVEESRRGSLRGPVAGSAPSASPSDSPEPQDSTSSSRVTSRAGSGVGRVVGSLSEGDVFSLFAEAASRNPLRARSLLAHAALAMTFELDTPAWAVGFELVRDVLRLQEAVDPPAAPRRTGDRHEASHDPLRPARSPYTG